MASGVLSVIGVLSMKLIKSVVSLRYDFCLIAMGHAGPGEGTKLHARKNFCVFYPIELKLCTMIEILIPNNRIVFVF